MRRLFVLLGLAVAFAPGSAPARPPSVRDFARQAEFRQVEISPTGKYLATISSPKKHPHAYSLTTFETQAILANHPKVLSNFTLRYYKLFGPMFWVSNSRIAVETATYVGGFDRPYLTGKLYATGVKGGHPRLLMSGFEGLLSLLPKRKNFILAERWHGIPRAYLINVYSGAHYRKAESPGSGGLAADNNGDVRLAFGVNSLTGKPTAFYRRPGEMKWQDYSKAIPEYVDSHGLSTPEFITFTPDNKKIYLAQYTDNANQTRGLFLADPDTRKETLIYANKSVDIGGSEFSDYGALIYSYKGDNLVGLRIMPGKVQTLALDARSPKMQDLAALSRAFPKQEARITSATRDGSESIVEVSSDTNPGDFYLFSHKPKPSLTLLFRAEPWIDPKQLSPMRPITFKARDGVTLHGYLTVPKGTDGKNLPMVVIVHGGPYGVRDHWGYDPEVQLLASRGYAVLQVNYRGSGGYGNRLVTLGIQHWGNTMQDDVADGVHWAISNGIANPRRICIYGGSYGGYSALMSAERYPDLYRCAIGYSGVYDLFVIKSRKSDTGRTASGRLYMREVLGSSPAELKKFSPVYQVASLKIPVLLMHGGEDSRAPVKGYDEMVSAIKKHGTPLQTLYFSREGHGFYKMAHRIEAYKKMLAFLGKYIGPGITH